MNLKPFEINWIGQKLPRMTSQYCTVSEGTLCMWIPRLYTREYGKLQLVKLLCVWRSQGTLTTKTLWLLKRTGKLLLDLLARKLNNKLWAYAVPLSRLKNCSWQLHIYSMKTGPLWSSQNVPQYHIVREMYTLVWLTSTLLLTFWFTKGLFRSVCAAHMLMKKVLSEPKHQRQCPWGPY